jgi:hypothetical protein
LRILRPFGGLQHIQPAAAVVQASGDYTLRPQRVLLGAMREAEQGRELSTGLKLLGSMALLKDISIF